MYKIALKPTSYSKLDIVIVKKQHTIAPVETALDCYII